MSVIEGTTGSDTLQGTENRDTIAGLDGNDTIAGLAGNDSILGGDDRDRILGNFGNDTVVGADGDDTIFGNEGNDSLMGDDDDDSINGGAGNDTLVGGDDDDTLIGGLGNDRVFGLDDDDIIVGDSGADTIDGGSDEDAVSYVNSNSAVNVNLATGIGNGGDAAGDRLINIENIIGSSFRDTLTGDSLDNVISGGAGADTIDGGSGRDTASYANSAGAVDINLGTGAAIGGDATGDTLINIENIIGSAFRDILTGDTTDNVISGGGGADTIDGAAGIDSISYTDFLIGVTVDLASGTASDGDIFVNIENAIGSDRNDTLIGSNSNNILEGNDGNDILDGGSGADTLDGGDDEDTARYATSTAAVNVDLSTGVASDGDVLIDIENLSGSQFNDTLRGDSSDNIISGSNGSDRLFGNAGEDTLEGGLGADTLDGGVDRDTASYENATRGVNVNLTNGIERGTGDTLINIEDISGSQFNDTLTGDGIDNYLAGNNGADRLNGRSGEDTLEGGSGADTLIGGSNRDTIVYENSTAAVNINLVTRTGSGGEAEGDVLLGVENIIASDFDDSLVGNGQGNLFEGGLGADTINGGSGSDTISYEDSRDRINVDLGTGLGSRGDALGDVLTNIENIIGSEKEKSTLIGSQSNNILVGGEDDDVLEGRGGRDTIAGGLGDDTILGGSGRDLLLGEGDKDELNGGSGADTLLGGSRADELEGGSGADFIDGGTDLDYVSYSGSSAAVNVNLATLTVSGGDATGDTIVGIENARGSNFNDTLVGDIGNNFLNGDGGADTLDGGAGSDSADYRGNNIGVNVNLATGVNSDGDTLINIENLRGSNGGADTLVGDRDGNIIYGFDGNDILEGKQGNDTIYGGDNNDTMLGGIGDDILHGNENDDFLNGNDGNDTISGGLGNDTVLGRRGINYLNGDLGDDSVVGGFVNDTVIGDLGSDTLRGDAGIDSIEGGQGNDLLDGGADGDLLAGDTGDDTLRGGGGNDLIWGDIGTDVLTGGSGADVFRFNFLQESTFDRGFDTITDLQIGTDTIDGQFAVSSANIAQLGSIASLNEVSIASLLTDTTFSAKSAATFSFGNRTFLAINDDIAGFSGATDSVIEITGFTGNLANLEIVENANPDAGTVLLPDNVIKKSPVSWNNTQLTPQQIFISSESEINDALAAANPGDTIVLRDGVYNDFNIRLNQPGVSFRAETAGGVTFTGESNIYIENDYITASGFIFDNVNTPGSPMVNFVGAEYSRFSNSSFIDSGFDDKDRMIQLRTESSFNRVDRNIMSGNESIGISVAGTRTTSSSRERAEQLTNWYNRIERNYIKDIPYPGGDVNGKEGIQLGNYSNSDIDLGITGRSIAEYNLLQNVDYDPEVISIKSNENIVRYNTIDGSVNGGLTLRVGDRNLVEGNYIFDTDGAIRINGANNQIINNYIDTVADRGIRLRLRDPSTNNTIANNTFLNTEDNGIEASVEPGVPWNANIYNNIWQASVGNIIDSSLNTSEIDWQNNIINPTGEATVGSFLAIGIIIADPQLTADANGILRPSATSPAIDAGVPVESVTLDIEGQPRDNLPDIGADERSNAPITNQPLTPNETGPFWSTGVSGSTFTLNTGQSRRGTINNDVFNVVSGGGNNNLTGNQGNDQFILGSNDNASGGSGNDYFEAKYGSGNIISAGSGNDEVIIARSNHNIRTGSGDDLIDATFSAGNSNISGGSGQDDFLLGSGDRVIGEEGVDRFFVGYGGNNTIIGGAGADEFWIANGFAPTAANTISDFQVGVDAIGISGLGITYNNLELTQNLNDTIVTAGTTQLAILQGVQANNLTSDSFIFT